MDGGPVVQQTWIVPLLQLVSRHVRRDRRRSGAGNGDPPQDIEDLAAESVDLQVEW